MFALLQVMYLTEHKRAVAVLVTLNKCKFGVLGALNLKTIN